MLNWYLNAIICEFVLGLHGWVLVVVELLASVRMCWKLPPCLVEPVSASFRMDMLLAKAGTIRNGSNAF